MQNRVGSNIPSPDDLAQAFTQLKDLTEYLKSFCVTLSSDERMQLLRGRVGAEPHVQLVHNLAQKQGIKLPGISLDEMQRDIELAKSIRPFVDSLRVASAYAEDTLAVASSESWEAFLAYYAVLQQMAARIPELAVELAPVTEFMARRRATASGGATEPKP